MSNLKAKFKLARSSQLKYVAASHENPSSPAALKKVLFSSADLPSGKIQMLNLATIPANKAFQLHYHEDMHEIFLITSGRALMTVDEVENILESGDAILIEPGAKHTMKALDSDDVNYIVFGVSSEKGGRTVVV